jgi:dTDP-4-amino-4,6-dideoxygalactose transaminase
MTIPNRTSQGLEHESADGVGEPSNIAIPLVDLKLQHSMIAETVRDGWARVMDASDFILGEEVRKFEDAYAGFCGVRHCVGVGSGTDALELILRAAGVGPGREVIVPTNSFIASASAVARSGATPVLADVDPDFQLIDPASVAHKVTTSTAAILAVHLFGQVSPVEQLREVSDVLIIEDAAQSHGATRHGRASGSLGLGAATSFYPGKNLGAYGDGGAILTNDDVLAHRVRAMRDHGSEARYRHSILGFNSRLDTLQAVVLEAKLEYLHEWNDARRVAAERYNKLLANVKGVLLPRVMAGNDHVWHQYVIRIPRRDAVLKRLREVGIGAGVHYPTPIHLQGAFSYLGHGHGDFPVAESLAQEILSLPIFPGITSGQQERIVTELRRSLHGT